MNYEFTGNDGTFKLKNPKDSSYLYMPLANEAGVLASITPDGHGDNKLSQNEFLLEPASVQKLHESMNSRNFWCHIEGFDPWSVFGYSAQQLTVKDETEEMEGGLLWQRLRRRHSQSRLMAEVLSFCPSGAARAELMTVTLKNEGSEDIAVTPFTAIPMFSRGAENLRDHRHVTSLLNRIKVCDCGVEVCPSMTFDERGHRENKEIYGVYAKGEHCEKPVGAYPTIEAFTGEGGNLLMPKAVYKPESEDFLCSGDCISGYEAMGALKFKQRILKPQETYTYMVVLSYGGEGKEYLSLSNVNRAFEEMTAYWQKQQVISVKTGNKNFNQWMTWVSIQPQLRKLYGCSFLPYHDYGRGGRGWRDLWQDCLALILRRPFQVREDLVQFFAGVRADGSNATIIGSRAGEFKADRNNIVRVWMDHGFWPLLTVRLYMDQTGDMSFLLEKNTYFKDKMMCRGEAVDKKYDENDKTVLKSEDGRPYYGTILEHLILQNVTQFYDVGEHGHMRLRGADWNDALDMAGDRGESVAFTAAYAGNLHTLAEILRKIKPMLPSGKVFIMKELDSLIFAKPSVYELQEQKRALLMAYCRQIGASVSGSQMSVEASVLADILEDMANWIKLHIKNSEIVTDNEGYSWFNSYYDNDSKAVEGMNDKGVRMMLTGQVFTIMSGTASDKQVEAIIRAADKYLYDARLGGYRLNTDFKEIKMNLGRMFGFAYGHKENGSVFCHMAVMYAYALYMRGFAREGYKVLNSIFMQSINTNVSRMYPGIPEYFDAKGRGMYPYLTGAASWFILTVQTQMYGVRGCEGNLVLNPKLLLEQFDAQGKTEITCGYHGKTVTVHYTNSFRREIGDYELTEVSVDGKLFECSNNYCTIPAQFFEKYDNQKLIDIYAVLE